MILSKPLRQQPVLRAVPRKPPPKTQDQHRRLHSLPPLTHGATFEKDGVPNLLSAEGYALAWTQYQSHVLAKLNLLTSGKPDYTLPTRDLAIKHARDASKASLFNHASMAHNNHLFFSTLSASPTPTPPSETLLRAINTSFSSLPSLRLTFLATANAMFGPGHVWLVKKNPTNDLAILTTYIAGSPYPGAHFRQQPIDMATVSTPVYAGMTPQAWAQVWAQPDAQKTVAPNVADSMRAGSFGVQSDKRRGPGGADLEVCMCVSTWEHVWLRDWGVGGKAAFLDAWWDRIDWGIVEQNAGPLRSGLRSADGRSGTSLLSAAFR